MDTLNIRFVFDRKNQANNTDKQGLLQIEVRETGTVVYSHQTSPLVPNQIDPL